MLLPHRPALLLAFASLSAFGAEPSAPAALPPAPPPTDWIDPATGHRIIQLSTEPGSSTLYFHDNAYSAAGDKFIFSAPGGVTMVDLTKLGTEPPRPEVVAPGGSGGYMARRTREVYFTRGGGRGGRAGASAPGAPAPSAATERAASPASAAAPAPGGRGAFGGGTVYAYNFDTKETRLVPHASRTLINADETLTLAVFNGEDPTGRTPKPAYREPLPQLQRMFPGKKMTDLTPDQQYAVTKEDSLARRAVNPTSQAFTFTNLKTGEAKTVGYQYGSLNHMQFSLRRFLNS
jgi:oligogalacturonide lyase